MIEINLVPENLRKKRRAQAAAVAGPTVGLPKEVILGMLGAFTALLIVLLLVFQGFIAMQIHKRNNLKKEHESIAGEKKNVDTVMKEMKDLKERAKTLESVAGAKPVRWSEKLNNLSDSLPRSIWLTKVALEGKYLIVEGSAVSKTKSEISDVHVLIGKLRSSKTFMTNLNNLELDVIKARNVDGLPIADFTIRAAIEK